MVRILIVTAAFLTAAAGAFAGDLVPTDPRFGPLRVKLHKVETTIDNQIAVTKVTQIFANDNDQRLEGIYIFPTPADASIIDFSMTINGKVVRGELLEKNRARQVYESIVSRAKDPGLLEQIGKNVFKMRVFPIEPKSEQKIELTYVERITYESGRCTWRYPLQVPGSKAQGKCDRMELGLHVISQIPLRLLTSSTHSFTVVRNSENELTASLNQENADLTKDVEFVYGLAREKHGFDLVAHRAAADADGEFAMLITPGADTKEEQLPKDMTFVFDTSGSMNGAKIVQARAALKFCVSKVAAQDRFNIVRFSDDVSSFRDKHVPATAENLKAAATYIDQLEALGSTNICGGLSRALEHRPDAGRPHTIVFLTDGQATVAPTEPREIIQAIEKANGQGARIFTFGVGDDVNRGLLEDLAEANRSIACFVKTNEDIETAVSTLQRRIVAPIIAGLEIDWGGAAVHSVYPKRIPDMYTGVQLLITGKYTKGGPSLVTLKGLRGTKEISISQNIVFPEKRAESEAIKYIWGSRKVADLLDRVRRTGETQEMVNDIVRLSREYRVATPYTSFLVLEDEAAYDREGIDRKGSGFKAPDAVARGAASKDDPGIYFPEAGESDHSESVDSEDFHQMKGDSKEGVYDAMGVGGGGAGRYGARMGGSKWIVKRGAGVAPAADSPALAGLKWLARHQNTDGSWSPYHKCEDATCTAEKGSEEPSTLLTALALSAFLETGFTQLSREEIDGLKMGAVVKAGLKWLLTRQDAEGGFDAKDPQSTLLTAVAACALSKASGMTGTPFLDSAAQKAIDRLVSVKTPGKAWEDAMTTAWAMLALRTAESAGLKFPRSAVEGVTAYKPGPHPEWKAGGIDPAAWLMGTLASMGGDEWKKWRDATVAALSSGKSKDGSWDGDSRGRVFSTAMNAMTLAVIDRTPDALKVK